MNNNPFIEQALFALFKKGWILNEVVAIVHTLRLISFCTWFESRNDPRNNYLTDAIGAYACFDQNLDKSRVNELIKTIDKDTEKHLLVLIVQHRKGNFDPYIESLRSS